MRPAGPGITDSIRDAGPWLNMERFDHDDPHNIRQHRGERWQRVRTVICGRHFTTAHARRAAAASDLRTMGRSLDPPLRRADDVR